MFPIVAIGGVISAVASVAKGVSWLSDKLDSTKGASEGGGGDARSTTAARASQFEAVLAAQAAGQSVPPSPSAATSPANVPPHQHGPDYDSLARMQAGMAAYSHVGEHRGNHPRPAGGGEATIASA
jgi:hypothetical protein